MKNTNLAGLIALSLAVFAQALPSRAADAPGAAAPATTCKDGTTSSSTGKGTCSGHGGVQKAPKTNAAPAAAPAAATAKTTTCKDGTTSTSTGKGTCSSHGGVQKAASPAN